MVVICGMPFHSNLCSLLVQSSKVVRRESEIGVMTDKLTRQLPTTTHVVTLEFVLTNYAFSL